MYARGLSTRDIEAAFSDASGRSLLSRSAVSQVTEVLWQQYEAFASRDLSEFNVPYLFVDGIAERLHLRQPREAVLCACAILEDGKKALLHLAPGTKEDKASCRALFHDLKHRRLTDPLPGASDAQPGSEGTGRSLARVQGAGVELLHRSERRPGGDSARSGGRHLAARAAHCGGMLPG